MSFNPAAPVPAPVMKKARPVSSLKPVALAAVVKTAAEAEPTDEGLVASTVNKVENIEVPPAADVGILVFELTERISTVTCPELEGVYKLALTPRIFHGRGILKCVAGVVDTPTAPVSLVNAMHISKGKLDTLEAPTVIAATDEIFCAKELLNTTKAPLIFVSCVATPKDTGPGEVVPKLEDAGSLLLRIKL
jgi:hypothetical protein